MSKQSGGNTTTAPVTVQELRDEKAKLLNQIDDILNTAKAAKRDLTAQERVDHDALVDQIEGEEGLDAQITAAEVKAADDARFDRQAERHSARFPTPNVNLNRPAVGAGVTRNLDDLLWATDENVQAGSISAQGIFRPNAATAAVEQVVFESDGRPRVAPRINAFRPEDRHTIRGFQDLVADMSLFGMMIDRSAKTSAEGFESAKNHAKFKDQWKQIRNALDTDTTAEGVEWVPTGIGASLHEKVRAAGKVAPLFANVNMPTNPWKWPLEGADATAYRVAEPTSDTASKVTASTPGTAAATFDAEILGGRILFSKSLDADSALAILPFSKNKLARSFVDAEEKAILDGDTDGTHQDSDTQAAGATHASSSWDGLRKRALAEHTLRHRIEEMLAILR